VASLLALEIDVGASPWGAVGRWFIPLINLVSPFRLFARIDAALHAGLSVIRRAWWALFLTGAIGPQVVAYAFDLDIDFPVQRALVLAAIASEVAYVVAAILGALLIARLQGAVNQRAEFPPAATMTGEPPS
jgi:hypothetical protein